MKRQKLSKLKQTSLLFLRLALASAVMLAAYIMGTIVIGDTSIMMTPQEASQAGIALVIVSLMNALVLSYLILHSPWHGLKLVSAIVLVHFGVETFMAQSETIYYNHAVQMGTQEFIGILLAGALRALIFAPLAVAIFGKLRKSAQLEGGGAKAIPEKWGKSFAALTAFYVLVYFMFGYFVAWQWEQTRLFYTGTTEIKPFFTHFWDLFFKDDPTILPFQLLRGMLWTLLTFLTVRMIKAKRWKASLGVALTFAVLLSLPLGLFPNPYLPPVVAQSHFVEISSSMLLFGGIAGWVLYRKDEYRIKHFV